MIDLQRTRAEMLAEIEAPASACARSLDDSTKPLSFADEGTVVLFGSRNEILPRLEPVLARRFRDVPPEQYIRDIVRPLKMGLGNAEKRGNRYAPNKTIRVTVVATAVGIVIEITDEGNGFDVAGTYEGFLKRELYFTNKGGGFKAFDRAGSVISYADGGRTMLIRFLCRSVEPTMDLALNERFMHSILRMLPTIAKRDRTLVDCHATELADGRPGQPEVRYELLALQGDEPLPPRVLTGRILRPDTARREHTVAKQLYDGALGASANGVRVPKPMENFKRHPRLVLYRFDPGVNLWRLLPSAEESLRRSVIDSVAKALRSLHRSGVQVDAEESTRAGARRREIVDTATHALSANAPGQAARLRRVSTRFTERASELSALPERASVHGSFGWDCLRRDGDRFYLYRFDDARLTHPGYDLGGFLADLSIARSLAPGRDRLADVRDAFLRGYLADEKPAWLQFLPLFTSHAMLERLARIRHCRPSERSARAKLLLDRCEDLLES